MKYYFDTVPERQFSIIHNGNGQPQLDDRYAWFYGGQYNVSPELDDDHKRLCKAVSLP